MADTPLSDEERADNMLQRMSAFDPKELRRLAQAATPGEWRVIVDDTGGEFSGWPSICSSVERDLCIIHRAGFKQEFWGDLSQREANANAALIAYCATHRDAILALAEGRVATLEEAAKVAAGVVKAAQRLSDRAKLGYWALEYELRRGDLTKEIDEALRGLQQEGEKK